MVRRIESGERLLQLAVVVIHRSADIVDRLGPRIHRQERRAGGQAPFQLNGARMVGAVRSRHEYARHAAVSGVLREGQQRLPPRDGRAGQRAGRDDIEEWIRHQVVQPVSQRQVLVRKLVDVPGGEQPCSLITPVMDIQHQFAGKVALHTQAPGLRVRILIFVRRCGNGRPHVGQRIAVVQRRQNTGWIGIVELVSGSQAVDAGQHRGGAEGLHRPVAVTLQIARQEEDAVAAA